MKDLSTLTAQCIRCGFCLESCPTFVISGKETESPRGRIYLARSAEAGKIGWEDTKEALDTCLGCRACETACPSGVHYGEILEQAREKLEEQRPHRTKHMLLQGISKPGILKLQLTLGHLTPGAKVPSPISVLLSREEAQADKPRAQEPAKWPNLTDVPTAKGEVYLLEGCAMRVLFPNVHEATRRLLRRVGYTVRESDAGCCGALHAHNGYLEQAARMSDALLQNMPGEIPIIVNSAGCGSWLKDQGCARVLDVTEFLLNEGLSELLATSPGIAATATYHDACHLAHGQGVRSQPRELLATIPGIQLADLNEADLCCGSAGIYNLTQPSRAGTLLERKWTNIEATGADLVVLGNPGCHSWIAQAAREKGSRIKVVHTAEILEASFSGTETLGA